MVQGIDVLVESDTEMSITIGGSAEFLDRGLLMDLILELEQVHANMED